MVDDFDIELEEAAKQARGEGATPKPAPVPSPTQPQPRAAAGSQPRVQASPPVPPRPMSSRKPGPIGRVGAGLSQVLGGLRLPRLDWSMLVYIFVGILVFVLLAQNWSPVRLNFFGIHVDIPKAVAFVVNIGLGMLALWVLQRHLSGHKPSHGGKEVGRP